MKPGGTGWLQPSIRTNLPLTASKADTKQASGTRMVVPWVAGGLRGCAAGCGRRGQPCAPGTPVNQRRVGEGWSADSGEPATAPQDHTGLQAC
jgi:hypothetical protein